MSGKVNLVLVKFSYNVQNNLNDDHANNALYGSSDMMDMNMVLGDLMKSGVHVHVICCALQFAICYQSFFPEKREVQSYTVQFSGE